MKRIDLESMEKLEAGGDPKEVIDTACYVAGAATVISFFVPVTSPFVAAAAAGYCGGYGAARILLD